MDNGEVKNYGLDLKPVTKEQWVQGSYKMTSRLGAQAGEINPSGDWTKYTPELEHQKRGNFDTQGCVLFSSASALITQANYLKWEFPKDSSERYLGVMCGTSPSGTDPHHAIEKIRTTAGLIRDSVLPWLENIYDFFTYYAPNPMSEEYIKLGQQVLKKYDIHHEWVFDRNASPKQKQDALKRALKRGTVCVSVRAWEKNGKYYTKDVGAQDGHWVQLIRYDGEVPVIRDQYEPFIKKLEPNYDFGVAKLYILTINKSGLAPFERSYFLVVLQKVAEALKRIMLQLGVWR